MHSLSLGWRALRPLALVAVASSVFADIPAAPVAKQVPVTDTYYGTAVVDPYRWMEQPEGTDFSSFLEGQNAHARAALAAIPGRKALAERILALEETITSSDHVVIKNGLVFYQKIAPGANLEKLYVRQGFGGAERVLVDPASFGEGSHHTAISYAVPSNDGALVAVALSAGGSEDAVIHVFETATGRELPDQITRGRFGVTSWRDDNRAFYYLRLQALAPGAPRTAKYQNIKSYVHVIGTDPEKDTAVFGIGVSPEVAISPDEFAAVAVDPQSPYAVGVVIAGVRRERALYLAPKDGLDSGHAKWTKLADVSDDVTSLAIHGSDVYLLTHKDAPRFKVIEVDAANPVISKARTVIAPSDRVIEELGVSKDALYVRSLEDGLGRITRIGWDGARTEVALPVNGTADGLETEDDLSGFIIQLQGWTSSPLWYAYDPAKDTVSDTHLDPPSPVDYSGVVAEEVKVPASDGTLVPLSIIRPKDIKLDGSNPTFVYAYGSYGINSNPSFSAVRLAWFGQGGIMAVAHVRGGGEYGEEWHQAGRGVNKIKTVTDFIDCAKWLVAHGYTSPAKLGARGGSAGGITMGLGLALEPQLFSAILDEIPVSDQLRIELTPNGPPNVPEFGSVKTEEGFKILAATSPVHHLKPGTPYPAVMLTTGANDPRVDPWQAAKMAATLQADTSSGKPILLRVDYEGGHGLIGATKAQAAELVADEYSFLLWNMGVSGFQPVP